MFYARIIEKRMLSGDIGQVSQQAAVNQSHFLLYVPAGATGVVCCHYLRTLFGAKGFTYWPWDLSVPMISIQYTRNQMRGEWRWKKL